MKISISKIRFNPENPRHFINPDGIDSLAASMEADGQLESVKVRELTPQDTPSQGCTAIEPAEYELFEGERRLRAAMKLGWTEIEAEVFTGNREDFSLKGFMNNNGEPYHWLDKYRYIADYMAKHPDLTQRQIADKLNVGLTIVNNANKVIPLLNEGAMAEIVRIANKTTDWEVPERSVVTLSGLANGQNNVLDLMERALKVLIAGKMTEKQVKKLAEWVKAGNSPESFGESGKTHPSPPEAGESQSEGATSVAANSAEGDQESGLNGGRHAKLLQELKDTGYFEIKTPAKSGLNIIIQDEDSGALAALGAAGAIWALGHPDGGKLDDNPYLADLPGLIKEVQGSRLNGQPAYANAMAHKQAAKAAQEESKVQGSKAQGVQSEGMVSKFQIPNSENPKLNSLDLVKNILTAASGHTPKTFSGKILKTAAMWMANKFNSSTVKVQGNEFQIPNSENPKLNSAKSQIPNGSAVVRNTIFVVIAIAIGAFALLLGLKKIAPGGHFRAAYSAAAQKPGVVTPVTYNKSREWKQAMQCFAAADYASAFMWLGKTEEKYGDQADIYRLMGDCENKLGNYPDAVELYEKYSKMNPDDEEIKAKIEELKSTVSPPAGMEEPTQEQ